MRYIKNYKNYTLRWFIQHTVINVNDKYIPDKLSLVIYLMNYKTIAIICTTVKHSEIMNCLQFLNNYYMPKFLLKTSCDLYQV